MKYNYYDVTFTDGTLMLVEAMSFNHLSNQIDLLVELKGVGVSKVIKREEPILNQCDGCQSGIEEREGLHVNSEGMPIMACTKDRYLRQEG